MMMTGRCHCGAISDSVEGEPERSPLNETIFPGQVGILFATLEVPEVRIQVADAPGGFERFPGGPS